VLFLLLAISEILSRTFSIVAMRLPSLLELLLSCFPPFWVLNLGDTMILQIVSHLGYGSVVPTGNRWDKEGVVPVLIKPLCAMRTAPQLKELGGR
jgi:hypothetical protein